MRRELVHQLFYDMLFARRFELAAAEQYTLGKIGGFLHLYPGEEAVAVGVLRAAGPGDYVVSTYREHIHALMRGVPSGAVMAELFGRATGCSGGYGGSMHLFDVGHRFLGGYGIVGETFPIAIGVAYWLAMNHQPDVAVCFFGEGAVNQGTFHESLNMAALWKLPVLFVCENNHYQIGTEIHRTSAVTEVYKRACAYNIPAKQVDGMDVLDVHQATCDVLQLIRTGNGPYLLECQTYRFRGHSMADSGAYRSALEVAELKARDPLLLLRQHALEENWITEDEIQTMDQDVEETVMEAVNFADQSPSPTELMHHVYAQPLDLYGGLP
jgi:pyruvate dehydrogenase E1 component alpha subunit